MQHPVGQGFFHSAEVYEDEEIRHRYVYDCGAMEKYAISRKKQIKTYLSQCGRGTTLHTLFLSHIHADHINGLNQLLDKANGISVDTIVLPLIDVADRLIAYARTAIEDGASAQNEFYRTFVVDPTAALARFQPRQIVFVKAGDRGAGAPGGVDYPGDPDDGDRDLKGARQGERGPAWVLAGAGQIQRDDPLVQAVLPAEPTQALVIPDTMALVTPGRQREWLLAPFVDPTIAGHRAAFLKALAAQRGLSVPKLEAWLAATANVQKLVTDDLADLAASYAALGTNLNITSMCLYSGPRLAPTGTVKYQSRRGRFFTDYEGNGHPLAWLATGDAALANTARRKDFLKHYRRLLAQVETMTLPHHGSDHNFHPDLLDDVNPRLCLAAADSFSTWKHPGPRTVQNVCGRGAWLQVVTSDTRSTTREVATIL